MNRRNFLKGLLFVGMLPLSSCMRPPNAKVSPAKLDCETAMSDAPGCEFKPPINAFEIQQRELEKARMAEFLKTPNKKWFTLNG